MNYQASLDEDKGVVMLGKFGVGEAAMSVEELSPEEADVLAQQLAEAVRTWYGGVRPVSDHSIMEVKDFLSMMVQASPRLNLGQHTCHACGAARHQCHAPKCSHEVRP